MKKVILILMTMLVFSCGQINSIKGYFAELTVNQTVGTTETEFIFDVNTNDELIGIYSNGELLESKGLTGYTFDAGEYLISAETANGAYDELTITVDAWDKSIIYTTRFIINVLNTHGADTPMALNYPILTHNGTEYDLEEMTPNVNGFPVKTVYSGTERLVYVDIDCSFGRNSFIFRTAENWAIHLDFLREELTVENMGALIDFVHYVEPEPDFDTVTFNLQGFERDNQQTLTAEDDRYILDGVETKYIDVNFPVVDGVKNISITLFVGHRDGFLFHSGNMQRFFGFDFVDMTIKEANKAMNILYEHEGVSNIYNVVYKYNPECEVLDDLVYGVDYY